MSRNKFSLVKEAAHPASLVLVLELKKSLRGCQTVLDLGCGCNSPARFLPQDSKLVGMDGYAPDLEQARRRSTHDELIQGDIREAVGLLGGRRFDACIAMDVIEHLTKEDGWKMLKAMEQIATKRVVIFTPNGFVPQFSNDGDLQQHLSGWEIEEMRNRGYQVLGMHGPRSLRGEKAVLKYRPQAIWGGVSVFCHYAYTRQYPQSAFSIFCLKKMDSKS